MEILVLEASTVSAKAAVFDLERGLVDSCSKPFATDVDTTMKHDIDKVMDALLEMGGTVAWGHDIQAIGCVCTGHSSIFLDQSLRPISPVFTWTFSQGSELTQAIRADHALTRALYQESGCMVHIIYPLYRSMYLRKTTDLPVNSSYIVSEGSCIFHYLTGERAESQSVASTSGFANIRTLQWSETIAAFSGIATKQFFPICSNHYAAPLRAEAAQRLHVKAGIPVSIPMVDGALNQLGAGMIDAGKMTVSIGTSGAMRIASEQPILPERMGTWCYHTLDKYLCGATISGAANCVDWFRRSHLPGHSYTKLEEMISIPEQDAPVFLPFLFGERCPGWRDERSGGFFNVRGSHTAADFYTAILEGIVFNLYQNYDILASVNGAPQEINLSGGVLNSAKWTQMVSDIFGHELITNTFSQMATVGAACLAFEQCGGVKSAAEYSLPRSTVRIIKPDMQRHAHYQKRFVHYLDIYEKTHNI